MCVYVNIYMYECMYICIYIYMHNTCIYIYMLKYIYILTASYSYIVILDIEDGHVN